jgi:hypothetical protein
MAMAKAEISAHAAEYRAKMDAAQAAEARGLYPDAVQHAMSAWDDIDGMLQFANKYENREVPSISAIDLVLKYAALLLDLKSVDACEAFLARSKQIQKRTTDDLVGRLSSAREELWRNHRLWTHIEQSGEARQDQLHYKLGGDARQWALVVKAWERMGLISRVALGKTYLLALSTRLGQVVSAKCPSCGDVAQAPKEMFLEPMSCPVCNSETNFVLLPQDSEHVTEG